MNFPEMLNRINARVDDEVPEDEAMPWLNDAKDELNIAVEATIPDIVSSVDTFDIPTRYHVALVLYACARFKEQDGVPAEAAHFMAQFDELKREFIKTYQVPPKYRDDRLAQNFIAEDGQQTFEITKIGYVPQYNRLRLYLNDLPYNGGFELIERSFHLPEPLEDGDRVTAVWEEHADIIEPPYKWMKGW